MPQAQEGTRIGPASLRQRVPPSGRSAAAFPKGRSGSCGTVLILNQPDGPQDVGRFQEHSPFPHKPTSRPRDLGPRLRKAGRVRAAAWQPGRRHLLRGYSSVCTAPAAWPCLSGWGLVASGMRPGLGGPAVWPWLPVFAPTAQLPALGNAGLIEGHVQQLRKVGGGGGTVCRCHRETRK